MKVFAELTNFAATSSAPEFRDRLHQLETLGATGVNLWDHIFTSGGHRDEPSAVKRFCDPLTTLAAVVAVSDSLEVQTTVMNSAWMNAGLQFRQWLQLAVFAGGERVTAGLGAGWNTEEYNAIGVTMQPYAQRMAQLEEILRVGRQLFDEGISTFQGEYVTTDRLPIAPKPAVPPRLLAGGGSDRILRIAGTYCDVFDLHGNPKYAPFKGRNFTAKHNATQIAISNTTVEDSREQRDKIRAASVAAGRCEDAVEIGMQMQWVIFTKSAAEKREWEELIGREWCLFDEPRCLDQVPCMLIGDAREMADLLAERQERFGLSRIAIKEQIGTPHQNFEIEQDRFLQEVVPLLP
jgi:alkanesulfonate monooxygenase SsuD/methylene tetrahydromethanopterin reductase-like flavin-dependent oxidoreductase (luciferase family)